MLPSTIPASAGAVRQILNRVEVIPMTDGSETVQESVSLHSERGFRSSESDETETIDSRGTSDADEETGRVVVDDTVEDPEIDIPVPEESSSERHSRASIGWIHGPISRRERQS